MAPRRTEGTESCPHGDPGCASGRSRPQTLQGPLCGLRAPLLSQQRLLETRTECLHAPHPTAEYFPGRRSCDSPLCPPPLGPCYLQIHWVSGLTEPLPFSQCAASCGAHGTQVTHRLRAGSFPSGSQSPSLRGHAALGPAWSQAAEPSLGTRGCRDGRKDGSGQMHTMTAASLPRLTLSPRPPGSCRA